MKDYTIIELGNIKLSFAGYDLWVGVFVDNNKRKLYVCLIPTLLLTIKY